MKICEIHCFSRTLKLREPYSIAYESVDRCENLFLHLVTDRGFSGWGCAAPVKQVTGETSGVVEATVRSTIEPLLKRREVFEYARIMEALKKEIPGVPSARTMVDMALFDLMAQKAGVSLYRLLGGYRDSIPTSITIGIQSLENTLENAKKYVQKGFRILKIKGGKNVHEDVEKLIRLHEVLGNRIRIRFDANQGYTLEDTLLFLKNLGKMRIELFEQPTGKGDLELLKQVTRRADVPVMADESLLSLNDVFRISRNHASDLINIKLMKTGGILEATHINSVARAAGIGTMVGCMDESALGITAGLHFALSRPNVLYADLDGHLDIMDDPFEGMLTMKGDRLIPPASGGIGWTGLKKIGI